MAKYSTKSEQRLLQTTSCPGEIVVRVKRKSPESGKMVAVEVRKPCDALIAFNASRCRKCKTRFARNALKTFRVPRGAHPPPAKRDWHKRFGF